jgi:hypothetical protein
MTPSFSNKQRTTNDGQIEFLIGILLYPGPSPDSCDQGFSDLPFFLLTQIGTFFVNILQPQLFRYIRLTFYFVATTAMFQANRSIKRSFFT